MNQKKNSLPTGTLAMSVPVSLCLEPQMTLGTVIQSEYMPSEPHGEGDIAVELWKKLEPGEK